MSVGIAQAAAVAGLHVESFRRLQARDALPFIKVGWRWRLRPASLFLLMLQDDVRQSLGLDLEAAAAFCRTAIPLLRSDWSAIIQGDRWLTVDDHGRPVLITQAAIFDGASGGTYPRPIPLEPTFARTKTRAAFAGLS